MGEKNKRLFPIYSHFRKYSPLHFMKKAGAALVKTITSNNKSHIHKVPKNNRLTFHTHEVSELCVKQRYNYHVFNLSNGPLEFKM